MRGAGPGTSGAEPPAGGRGSGELIGPRFAWLLLFLALFGIYYALHGERITPDPVSPARYRLLTGDEPHYFFVAHSLAFDGDIDLANNRRRKDFLAFANFRVSGYVKSRRWLLRRVGRHSSLHAESEEYWRRRALPTQPVGTSALIVPAYRLGHWWGRRIRFTVTLFFHALAAATALVTADLSWRLTRSRAVSLLVAAGFALSAPLLFYSVPVYPDLPGALLIALSLWLLVRVQQEEGAPPTLRALALGICSAALPWLHPRFWPSALLLLVAGAWLVLARRPRRAPAAGLLLPWALSAAGLVLYHQALFGVPWPVSMAPPFSLAMALGSGWPGLLFDRDRGLLMFTPLAVFSFPGLAILWRTGAVAGRAAVLLLAGYFALVGSNAGWPGGLSPPLRYWVPAIPPVALAAAAFLAATPKRMLKVAAAALGAAGCAAAVWGMLFPWLLFRYRYRHPLRLHGPWAEIHPHLPSYFPQATPGALAAALLAAVALALFTRWALKGVARGK